MGQGRAGQPGWDGVVQDGRVGKGRKGWGWLKQGKAGQNEVGWVTVG